MNPHSVGDTQKASGLASLAEGTHLPNAIFGSASPRRRALSNPRPLLEEVSIVMPKSTAPRAPPVTPPRKPIQAANLEKRSASPDLATMIAKTPRPRRRSLATTSPASRLLSRSGSANAVPSSWKKKASVRRDDVSVNVDYGTVLRGDLFTNPEVDLDEEDHLNNELDGDGSESDSSIDLHTPLPHLMFRDGLLSPRSKLLPQVVTPSVFGEPDIAVDANRSESVLSVVSTTGTAKTKTGFFKDPRDTQRRRVRHRDGRLLRAGMGLTTGLGWSDSEDEDAPSTLTRRLIHTSIAKGPPLSPISSRPSSQLVEGTTQESTSPIQRSFLKKVPLTRSASTSFSWVHPDKSEPVAPNEGSIPVRARAQSNASASTASIYSMASLRRTPPLDTSDPSVSTRSRTTSSASSVLHVCDGRL
ncbi:hypothetical protein B0H21DRAFT_90528 [Amylocystis lapponica]|nr:hypothetical protein B0H21DRAFT_90528 [Amylocystis lapponica]